MGRSRLSWFFAGLLCAGLGCKQQPSPRKSSPRYLPKLRSLQLWKGCAGKHLKTWMDEAWALPPRRASKYVLRRLLHRCKKIPPKLRFYIEGTRFPSTLPTLAKIPGTWDPERIKRACPGLTPGLFLRSVRLASPEKELFQHKHCRGPATSLFAPREFQRSCASIGFVLSARIYQWLVDDGVAAGQARRFVRRFLLNAYEPKRVALLDAPRALNYRYSTTVEARRLALLLGGHKLLALKKGQVAPRWKQGKLAKSLFVVPLYSSLQSEVRRKKKIARNTRRRYRGELLLRLHAQTPYRLLNELLYTGHTAGFRRFFLLVANPRYPYRGCPRRLPVRLWPEFTVGKKAKTLPTVVAVDAAGKLRLFVKGRAMAAGCRAMKGSAVKHLQKRLGLLWSPLRRPPYNDGGGWGYGGQRRIFGRPKRRATRLKAGSPMALGAATRCLAKAMADRRLVLFAPPKMPFAKLLKVLVALRHHKGKPLFSEIYLFWKRL